MRRLWTVLAAILLLGAAMLAGRYLWPRVPASAGGSPSHPVPEVAKPTPEAAVAERAPVAPETCRGLTEIVDAELLAEVGRRHRLSGLAPKRAGAVAGQDGKEVGAVGPNGSPVLGLPSAPVEVQRSLLALVDTRQPARWGSEVAVTLAEGASAVTVTSLPHEPPRFAFRRDTRFELGLGGAATFGSDGTRFAPAVLASFDLRLAQTRRVDHGLRVFGVLSQNSTIFAGYVAGFGSE